MKKYIKIFWTILLILSFGCLEISAGAEEGTKDQIIENRDDTVTGLETEENDSAASATELATGDVLAGNISGENDVDYYHMHFDEKCMGRVLLTLPYNITKGMFRVSILFKEGGGNLTTLHNLYSGEVALNYSNTFLYVPGDYYFVVSGYKVNPQIRYHIRFSRLFDEAGKITSLTAGLDEEGNIELNWGKIFSATGYHVYLKENDYTEIGTVSGAEGSFLYRVKNSGNYSFVVAPYYRIGGAEYETCLSDEISFTIPASQKKPKVSFKKYKRRYTKVRVTDFCGAKKVYIYMKKGRKSWIRKKVLTPGKRSCKIYAVKKCAYRFKARGYVSYGSKKIYSSYTKVKRLNFKR